MFTRYGASARDCLEFATDEETRLSFEANIMPTLHRIDNLQQVMSQINTMSGDLSLPSKLFTLVPDSLHTSRVTIASPYIASKVFEAIREKGDAEFWALYNSLRPHTFTTPAAGWLWDCHVIGQLCRNRDPIPKARLLPPQSAGGTAPAVYVDILPLHFRSRVSFGGTI